MDKRVIPLIIMILVVTQLSFVYGAVPDFGENNTALGQVTDDYRNDDYLNATYNVIRNSTLNCMELNYSIDPVLTYENYSAMTELDGGGKLVVNNATMYTVTDLDLDDETRLYRDLGSASADKWVNFSGVVDVKMIGWASNGEGAIFCIAQELDDYHVNHIIEGIVIRVRHNTAPAGWQILLSKLEGGAITSDSYLHGDDDANSWFFMNFNRTGANVYVTIYSDRARTGLLDTLAITLTNATIDYRYLYGMNSRNRPLNGRSLDFEGYRLGFWAVGGGYENGYYYTENIMVNATGGTLVHLTNITLPANTGVTVEYSSNNATWLDHLGNAGSDTLIAGYYALDMRNLNYTVLYQRFNLTTTDSAVTPRIFQSRIVTTYTEGGGGLFYPLVLWGILAILIITITLALSRKRR